MRSGICSCQGFDANCKKCHGSGIITVNTSKNSAIKNDKKNKIETFLTKDLGNLTKEEVENIAIKIIGSLDLKSKKQMQILNSIPFSTNTFRRDFGSKFEQLEQIEAEKQHLRNELLIVDQEIILKNYKSNFTFKHYLSDKDVDVKSNRQLKGLIREYKSLKNKSI